MCAVHCVAILHSVRQGLRICHANVDIVLTFRPAYIFFAVNTIAWARAVLDNNTQSGLRLASKTIAVRRVQTPLWRGWAQRMYVSLFCNEIVLGPALFSQRKTSPHPIYALFQFLSSCTGCACPSKWPKPQKRVWHPDTPASCGIHSKPVHPAPRTLYVVCAVHCITVFLLYSVRQGFPI